MFGVATFLSSWVILVFTAPGIPIVWDEGEYLYRASRIIEWFRLGPGGLSSEAIRSHWMFISQAEGHPAGFVLPIALGQWLASSVVDPLMAARLGPITLFSVACSAIAVRLKEDYGTAAAVAAPVTLLTFPRIFAEAHFATQDGQLTAWWLVLWALQSSVSRGAGITVMVGAVLGLTTATKFTGWLAWAPTMVSEAVRKKSAARRLLIILPVALFTFYLVNPNLWHEPYYALRDHFHRSLHRAYSLDIPIRFLGRTYSIENPLPWHNTLTWLLLVTPPATLVLGIVGVIRCATTPTAASLTVMAHWLTLMVARALPGTPPHDGIRLFLPAFGFWCVLAGIGAQTLVRTIGSIRLVFWRAAFRAALVVALLTSAVDVVRYYPQLLSHYSVQAGGLAGAVRMGMEPAYWWDALDTDVLNWLNEHTGPGESVAFSAVGNLKELRDWHRLHPNTVVEQTGAVFKWYVLQNRPGLLIPVDLALMSEEQPVYVKYAGRRREGAPVPADLDVPLILVFSYEQYQRARR